MSIVRAITGYPTSTDYGALWELAQRQSVVCLVEYKIPHKWGIDHLTPGTDIFDVAQTMAIGGCEDGWQVHISCRGTGYVQGWNESDFVQQCERAKVQWLVPGEVKL